LSLELELGIEAATLEEILDRHERAPSSIIAVLQDVQDEVNYLPEGALRYVAESLDIPVAKVFSLATFYRAFSLEPRGEHIVQVCTGTACHVRGAVKIIDVLEREMDIRAGETSGSSRGGGWRLLRRNEPGQDKPHVEKDPSKALQPGG
jgi:NADH-quinone oxidoreductase subunit E